VTELENRTIFVIATVGLGGKIVPNTRRGDPNSEASYSYILQVHSCSTTQVFFYSMAVTITTMI